MLYIYTSLSSSTVGAVFFGFSTSRFPSNNAAIVPKNYQPCVTWPNVNLQLGQAFEIFL